MTTRAILFAWVEASGFLLRICFNAFNPNYDLLKQVGIENMDIQWNDVKDPSLVVKRYFVRESVDMLNQFFVGYFIYRTFKGADCPRGPF